MGLFKAAYGAAGGTFADQWKEYFYCEAMPATVMAVKGRKRTSDRSSNTKGSDNIISSGSVIAVADGQCVLIVEQGKVVEVCAEPGEFVFDGSTEPTIFAGDLNGDSIDAVLHTMGRRFTFGAEAPRDQRVYYFNTKELVGNKYGTMAPVPFRVVDPRAGIDMDIGLKCFGEYSIRMTNPVLFYVNVCGNFESVFERSALEDQMRTELLFALQPAFAKLSEMGIRYSALPGHAEELGKALNEVLSAKWRDMRGLEVTSMGISSLAAGEEDEAIIKQMQREAAYMDPTRAAAAIIGAQGDAMRDAAKNPGGTVGSFMGVGMARGMGGADPQSLFAMGRQGSWTCPACGTENRGKFCTECGGKKPAGAPQYKCDKCGWELEDPTRPPKFCPECGDPFGDEDVQS